MPPCIGFMCQALMWRLQLLLSIDMLTCLLAALTSDGDLTGMQNGAPFHPLHLTISVHAEGTTHLSVTC